MDTQYTILAVNPGSTSTKIALYVNDVCQFKQVLLHSRTELAQFNKINDQYDFRRTLVEKALLENNVDIYQLSAVVGPGGPLKPMISGTYLVDDSMCDDLKRGVQAEHASNLGGLIAKDIADKVGIKAFIVDPISVDEFEPFSRITGIPEIARHSLFHALNLKAVAHHVANDLKTDYNNLTLVMAHLGGGISVGVQRAGKMIDASNPCDSGPFSPERAGSVSSTDLVNMCFSGKYTLSDMKKKLVGDAGLVAHLGMNDGRAIEQRILNGDTHAALIYESMAYQVAKEIGAMSTVVAGKVDAIVLTGGLAHSEMLVQWITKRVAFIAQVIIYPGEDELRSLVEGVLRVLRGEEKAKSYL